MNPMYITFAIYLVAVLLIGLAAYFSTRNFRRLHPRRPQLGPVRDRNVCRCFRICQVGFDGLARCHLPERFE